ncbi:hypothetical protein NQZ68_037096 [Dissostichus eleginoides]|nr:hypothetical protein NQZ68_037096 [Dissostichus eleginoides]
MRNKESTIGALEGGVGRSHRSVDSERKTVLVFIKATIPWCTLGMRTGSVENGAEKFGPDGRTERIRVPYCVVVAVVYSRLVKD